jgi:hypothetical protein
LIAGEAEPPQILKIARSRCFRFDTFGLDPPCNAVTRKKHKKEQALEHSQNYLFFFRKLRHPVQIDPHNALRKEQHNSSYTCLHKELPRKRKLNETLLNRTSLSATENIASCSGGHLQRKGKGYCDVMHFQNI